MYLCFVGQEEIAGDYLGCSLQHQDGKAGVALLSNVPIIAILSELESESRICV